MPSTGDPLNNQLLAALPIDAQLRIFPHLALIPLHLGKTMYGPEDELRDVYFPSSAAVSQICILKDGSQSKISSVGHEGVLGLNHLMGGGSTPVKSVVSVAGFCYRLPIEFMRRECDNYGDMQKLLLRYVLSLITQTTHTVICNRDHTSMQKLCRWLLTADDRFSDSKILTNLNTIAREIGTSPVDLDRIASELTNQNMISLEDGYLRVLDREKLIQNCPALLHRQAIAPTRPPLQSLFAQHRHKHGICILNRTAQQLL